MTPKCQDSTVVFRKAPVSIADLKQINAPAVWQCTSTHLVAICLLRGWFSPGIFINRSVHMNLVHKQHLIQYIYIYICTYRKLRNISFYMLLSTSNLWRVVWIQPTIWGERQLWSPWAKDGSPVNPNWGPVQRPEKWADGRNFSPKALLRKRIQTTHVEFQSHK